MKIKNTLIQSVGTSLGIAALIFGAATAHASSSCKGLERGQCDSNPSCTWVDRYQRKDGSQVEGYCRGKGGKKPSGPKEDQS